MLAAERRARILSLADHAGVVRVSDLVSSLGVSDVTIRRDLDELSRQGLLDKVHGGATRPAGARRDSSPTGDELHIGVLIPTATEYFRDILAGIRRELERRSVRFTVSLSDYRADREEALVEQLRDQGADGLLMVPSVGDSLADYPDWMGALDRPAVLVEREPPQGMLGAASSVRTSHEQGVGSAMRHLHELGHRRIALVTRGDSQAATFIQHGWEHACAELDLADAGPPISGRDVGSWPRWTAADVQNVLRHIMDRRATAVVCHNDENALTIVQQAQREGISVPDELSVVAYEDEIAALSTPPLTAVAPPKTTVGALSARLLLDLIAEEEPTPARHVRVEPRLVIRSSTASVN